MQSPTNVIELSVEQSTKIPSRSSFAAASAVATAAAFSYSTSFVESPEFVEFSARALTSETLMHELAQVRADAADLEEADNEVVEQQQQFGDESSQVCSQWHIEQYELQHALQNATKNYVCTPLQSMEAQYVEQFKKMSQRETILKEVPVAETNRFDVSSQLKLNDEESSSLEELVKAFRTRKLQRVGVLRKNQTVCEESLRSQCRYMLRWFKSYVTLRLKDTFAEVTFALKLLCLYTN